MTGRDYGTGVLGYLCHSTSGPECWFYRYVQAVKNHKLYIYDLCTFL